MPGAIAERNERPGMARARPGYRYPIPPTGIVFEPVKVVATEDEKAISPVQAPGHFLREHRRPVFERQKAVRERHK